MELPQVIDGHRFQIAVFHWTHKSLNKQKSPPGGPRRAGGSPLLSQLWSQSKSAWTLAQPAPQTGHVNLSHNNRRRNRSAGRARRRRVNRQGWLTAGGSSSKRHLCRVPV
jgi:hypothetical protein